MKNWFSDTDLFFYVLEHHTHDNLNPHPLTQHRIAAEIIAQAENLSLGITTASLGELSPMKSFFQTVSGNKENSEHYELFFQTSELGEDILLELHQSKKDLYFAPSYVVSSFLDDLSTVFTSKHNPQPNIIYYLFKKYFWSFALSRHGADVSFSVYDHGKMTCALACALHAF
ncbi:hypothetical protein RZS08_39320, partial [Arthrospira platensis SPKY1]|nr:hypothetical protein [Arthrospira platensis SPKY1]